MFTDPHQPVNPYDLEAVHARTGNARQVARESRNSSPYDLVRGSSLSVLRAAVEAGERGEPEAVIGNPPVAGC